MGKMIRMSNFGLSDREYETKNEWGCYCQSGSNGLVFSKEDSYETAFFEAFPRKPKCFIRGEGTTVEEAEKQAWDKWQKIQTCKHEMGRRNRTDGYAYCKHCSYSDTVFEPLTKCCKCKIPTAYTEDSKGNSYCKKHARLMPKKLEHTWNCDTEKRFPRKLKKVMKYGCSMLIYKHSYGKIKIGASIHFCFIGNGYISRAIFNKQRRKLIELWQHRKTIQLNDSPTIPYSTDLESYIRINENNTQIANPKST